MGRHFSSASTIFVLVTLAAMGTAEAAGTHRVTFKCIDNKGIEQPLLYSYLYLRNSSSPPPMEKHFSPADYIYGPAKSSGKIKAIVPEGEYYYRLTIRNPLAGAIRPYGPPEPGDYSRSPGTPIIITGVVKDEAGNPLVDRYIRAQPEPCIKGDYTSQYQEERVETNYCCPTKYLAQERTDVDGGYMILM